MKRHVFCEFDGFVSKLFLLHSFLCKLVFYLVDLKKDPKPDTFAEKLVANVIKNLEVTVSNIHVRYEDTVTDPSKPFSVGVTLHGLSLRVINY